MKKNHWILIVFISTFLLSIVFSYLTNLAAFNSNLVLLGIVILLVILIGIIADMIGSSSLISEESTFHAMNSQKIKGAKNAVYIIKHNVKIASVCNDIIGDICGIVSGGLGAVFALEIANNYDTNITLITILVASFISSLTVGGKAIGKSISSKKSDKIIFIVARIMSFFNNK